MARRVVGKWGEMIPPIHWHTPVCVCVGGWVCVCIEVKGRTVTWKTVGWLVGWLPDIEANYAGKCHTSAPYYLPYLAYISDTEGNLT